MDVVKIPKGLQQNVDQFVNIPLDQEQQLYLAKIVILWNKAEVYLKALVGELLEKPGKAELLTADMGNVAIWQLASNLVNYSIRDLRFKEYVLLVLELYELVRSKRNYVVHGHPVLKGDGPSKISRSLSAKSGKGTISTKDADVTLAALKFLAETIALLELAILHSYGWLSAIAEHHEGKLRKPYSGPPFVGIDLLQNRIGLLRPQPHTAHKAQRRRPPSPE